MIEKALAIALEPIVDKVIALEKRVQDLPLLKGEPGPAGKDVAPAEVVALIKQDTAFVDALKGEPGKDGSPGKDGRDADPVEVDPADVVVALKADPLFMAEVTGKAGDPGKDGEKGERGDMGEPGRDGAGIDAPVWHSFKVYREGSIVQHHIGQHFRALSDTVTEPGQSDDWQRIGTAGLRWRGLKPDAATLTPGDFYIDGGSLFMQGETKASMIVQRGAKGDRGEQGEQGRKGDPGIDGRSFVAGTLQDNVLVFCADDGSTVDVPCDAFSIVADLAERVDKLASVLALQETAADDVNVPLRAFRGEWSKHTEYQRGDMVKAGRSQWVAVRKPRAGMLTEPEWTKVASWE